MSPDSRALVLQSCRHCGAGAPAEVHFCPHCDRILSLARHGDYFAFFGLPHKLGIDLADLERRFRDLSRQFHPDYFYNASTTERLASLERSSYLNDAYRVLRQPLDRVEYLLKLEGCAPAGKQGAPALEPGLLEEVFGLNEELDAIRRARAADLPGDELDRRLAAAGRPIEARAVRQEGRLAALMARWDELQDAEAGLKPCSTSAEAGDGGKAGLQGRSTGNEAGDGGGAGLQGRSTGNEAGDGGGAGLQGRSTGNEAGDGGGAGLQACSTSKRETLDALRTLLHERSYVENLLQLLARERGEPRR